MMKGIVIKWFIHAVLIFVCFVFVTMDINPMNWLLEVRLRFVFSIAFAYLIIYMFDVHEKENK